MPSITRVEFSVGPSLKSLRVVVLIEFPDEMLQQIKKGKPVRKCKRIVSPWKQSGRYIWISVRGDMTFISSTPGKIKKRESLGEPHYITEDNCSVWVIKRP